MGYTYTMTKYLIKFISFTTGAILAAIVLGAMFQPITLPEQAEATPPTQTEVKAYAAIQTMVDSVDGGDCWTGGEGHPFPTTVYVWTKVVDPATGKKVETVSLKGEREVNRRLTDWDMKNVAAFCAYGHLTDTPKAAKV